MRKGIAPRQRRVQQREKESRLGSGEGLEDRLFNALTAEVGQSRACVDLVSGERGHALTREQAEVVVGQLRELKIGDRPALSRESAYELVSYFRTYEADLVFELITSCETPSDLFLLSGRLSERVRSAARSYEKEKYQITYEPTGTAACPNCKQDSLMVMSLQTRRADESTGAYVSCSNCGYSSKHD